MAVTKPYESLTIRDYFMFGKICSKPQNRKLIIDSLLQIDLQEKSGEIEKHIQQYNDTKYARLDLLAEDYNGKIYNAEMQNKSSNSARQKELPNRSRYYQSILDTAHFNSGDSYICLPETYIIFICTFDPFGKSLPIYSFDTKCNEIALPEYNDHAHKIFFNTTADLSGLPCSVQNMLEYINSGVANDAATHALDNEISEARLVEEWRDEYMRTITYRDEVFADGKAAGFADGFADGKAKGFIDGKAKGITLGKLDSITTLFSNGGTDEDAKRLLNATDEDILVAKSRNLQTLSALN